MPCLAPFRCASLPLAAALVAVAPPAQQAVLMADARAEVSYAGGVPSAQVVPAGAVFAVGQGFALRAELPALPPPEVTAELQFALAADAFDLRAAAFASLPLLPVAAATSVTMVVTLPIVEDGSLHFAGECQPSGGPGFGNCRIEVDVGDDGTLELVLDGAVPGPRATSVFVAAPGPVPVRIAVAGALASTVFDHYVGVLGCTFVAGSCPIASYGAGCFPLDVRQDPAGVHFAAAAPPGAPVLLVFGWQRIDQPLPSPFGACRQLVTADLAVWLGPAASYDLPHAALPPGFALFVQAAALAGGLLPTSNGLAWECPP